MKMQKRALAIAVATIVLALAGLACGGSEEEPSAPTASPTIERSPTRPPATPTNTPEPTNTPKPTSTPEPTDTPAPTNTPEPTDTPEPTPTSTPVPEPEVFTGTGDAVIDVERIFDFALAHIVGNSASRHMSVESYDEQGNRLDLLVNTSDPYDGFRGINMIDGETTARFQVSATGEWTIEILPLAPTEAIKEHMLWVPGTYESNGDNLILLQGETPDLATIIGNADARHFAVISHNGGRDLLVNTSDPYEGTVILDAGTLLLQVFAHGPWSIEVTAK